MPVHRHRHAHRPVHIRRQQHVHLVEPREIRLRSRIRHRPAPPRSPRTRRPHSPSDCVSPCRTTTRYTSPLSVRATCGAPNNPGATLAIRTGIAAATAPPRITVTSAAPGASPAGITKFTCDPDTYDIPPANTAPDASVTFTRSPPSDCGSAAATDDLRRHPPASCRTDSLTPQLRTRRCRRPPHCAAPAVASCSTCSR